MSKPYKTCPLCGCNLDHGETCDCERKAARDLENSGADQAHEPATPDEREPALAPGA